MNTIRFDAVIVSKTVELANSFVLYLSTEPHIGVWFQDEDGEWCLLLEAAQTPSFEDEKHFERWCKKNYE